LSANPQETQQSNSYLNSRHRASIFGCVADKP
jgi:hypothetical protein